MLKNAYLASVTGHTDAYCWYSEFKVGRMEQEDLARSGCLVTMQTNEKHCSSSCRVERTLSFELSVTFGTNQYTEDDYTADFTRQYGEVGIFSSRVTMLLH